ncbi:alpha-xenorhabdolysin family binary toxin subunit A [Pseudomonas syringae pv. actinidiae]|uniref:ATPase and permease component n=1 Tax=Pseudomonas syringae pv. actinidiae TaxID=103796 RepID=A0AAN4Q1F8_PSESF|nr:alpha-xenorhabdolysin family binary toxin subunit A [Pseudomonas syringae]EPN55538.1 binary cytotoxin component [Pseudomonas syringae pv. actinidiae ICMP 19079]EPN86507.1 binary cytotoxin component [Pseudomonas syringae pv. actinidiae ICMP 19101]AKT28702.1 toxin [Pseudomonas syringae pv. actinidiae ICMP 18884]AOE55230.1 toxin [Pseudomonas syringae pv. actinidiae ICMP 18708]APP96091.1 toxin [Pseudomonas syringae pv. actinidiae]
MVTSVEPQFTDGEAHTVEDVGRVGKDLMNVLSGKGEGVARAPGLLITNEDVRRIRRYVNTGLSLPTKLEEVSQLVGGSDNGIAGLAPDAMAELYVGIQTHARSWSAIETNMQKVGSDLYVFSGNLITIATNVVDFIKGLQSYQTLQVGDLTPAQIDQMPPVALMDQDSKKIPGLLALVDDLKVYIKDHSASTTRTRVGVTDFKRCLKDEIAPGVALKIRLARSGNAGDEIARLTADVDQLNNCINQKLAEYEEYSEYKWIGFWWGVIGGVVSYSIYGPKATAALSEKDHLIKEKRLVELTLKKQNRLLGGLLAFETSLQDLKTRIDGAASGVSNIESLWVLLEELVESSHDRIKNTNNALYLVSFVSRFQTLLANWKEIKVQSFDLLTAFNNALEEPAV